MAEVWDGKCDQPDEFADEEVDPRVEETLSELTEATNAINLAENRLEESKKAFRQFIQQVQAELKALSAKVGKRNIERARPYHEALHRARKAHYESRQAALFFEKANAAFMQAKRQVAELEGMINGSVPFTTEMQTKLNEASDRFAESDRQKRRAEQLHGERTEAFLAADKHLMEIAKQRKSSILKTRPYYETKVRHDKQLAGLKHALLTNEQAVAVSKTRVANALQRLEQISEEIHQKRQKRANGGESAEPNRLAKELEKAREQEAEREARRRTAGDMTTEELIKSAERNDSDDTASRDTVEDDVNGVEADDGEDGEADENGRRQGTQEEDEEEVAHVTYEEHVEEEAIEVRDDSSEGGTEDADEGTGPGTDQIEQQEEQQEETPCPESATAQHEQEGQTEEDQ